MIELPDGTKLIALDPTAGSVLTPAEHAVAALAILGHDNAEIARLRGTSIRTVANLLARTFRKLGVGSRGELAALARSGRRSEG